MKEQVSELKNEIYEARLNLFKLIEKLKAFEKTLEKEEEKTKEMI